MTGSWTRARAALRRADARFGDHWWAPLGYVAVLLGQSVRAWFR